MLYHLDVPVKFNRNTANVNDLGAENAGQKLIELAMRESGRASLKNADVLDIGCGVRFTQTFINRSIPIGSYTGIEIHPPIVDFLKKFVQSKDTRFRYAHLDVQNALYNPKGKLSLSQLDRLPIDKKQDQIWLFSVFTHLNPEDAKAMLRILRNHIRPSGMLLFSAFIDPDLDGFEDRLPTTPLLNAYFGLETMRKMLSQTGWIVKGYQKRNENDLPIVDYFNCSPKE
jgi:SAM-dependent methyltransferase